MLSESIFFFTIFCILFQSFFLSFLSSLYSEIDLFSLELSNENKKLTYILKNGNLFFFIICFLQIIINMIISKFITENKFFYFLTEKGLYWPSLIFFSLMVALVTEISGRQFGNSFKKKFINNSFLINCAFLIIFFFSPLNLFFKAKKKVIPKSIKKDILKLMKNLKTEKKLDLEEEFLISSVLDEKKNISRLVVPWEKLVFLGESMSWNEILAVHEKNYFSQYPILSKKNRLMGILFVKKAFKAKKNIKEKWTDFADKDILEFSTKKNFSRALWELKKKKKIAIIKRKKKTLGLLFLKDLVDSILDKNYERK